MAAVASVDTITLTINEVEVEVPKGELIVESVKRLGLEVPIFCYHTRMKPVGMCRMCLVEVGFKQPDGSVRKMPKPQTACTLPASEGMVVYTDTEMVHRDRRSVLEFLLINHPLDCPICDRGGECPLQNNTLFYGPSTSRYLEIKRHLPKAFPLSKYVTLDLERCIQCGRCVRFTEEISGDAQLAFRFRGAEMQPSTFGLGEFNSKFSGNTIEICPVGALTSSKYRFRARPWDLETSPAICTKCSNGCNIWFDHRVGKFVRVNGRVNEAVNEEWTCDKGKFGHDWYNSEKRLLKPRMRKGDQFIEAGWAEAYGEILKAFKPGGNKVAALVEPTFSNEGLYLLQKLFRGVFGSNNLDSRWVASQPAFHERLTSKLGISAVQTSLQEVEDFQRLLVFGTSLADYAPILFLRVRKAWFNNGARVIVAYPQETEVDSFADVILRYKEGTEAVLAAGLFMALAADHLPPNLEPELASVSLEVASRETGVPIEKLNQAVEMLRGEGLGVVSTTGLLDFPQGAQAAQNLAQVALLCNASFNLYPELANEFGAELLGVLPDTLPGGAFVGDAQARQDIAKVWGFEPPAEPGQGTQQILEACARGEIKTLWIVGADPIEHGQDRALTLKALEKIDFLVYQGCLENEVCSYASVILPMAAPAEQDGTYTNLEGRVQRLRAAIPAPGETKAAWRIFSEVALRAQPATPLFNPEEVMNEIAQVVPRFEAAKYPLLEGEGVRVI